MALDEIHLILPQEPLFRNQIKALFPDPDLTTLFNCAQAAQAAHHWDAAIRLYEQAEVLAPLEFRLPNNRGNCHWLNDRLQEALIAYRNAILLEPADHRPWRGLGNVLRDLNRFEEADRAFSLSRRLQPTALTSWNHSQLLIGQERYSEAWALSEQRFEMPQHRTYRPGPSWRGWDRSTAPSQPLHVWSEQGFGDTFQFLRWVLPLSALGVPVVLEVEPQLVALLQRGLSWLPAPPQVDHKQDPPPVQTNASHGSLMSLPYQLGGNTLSSQAFHAGPYLRLPRDSSAASSRRIGVVWATGRKLEEPFAAREYHKRSLPLSALQQLLKGLRLQGWRPVNLQVGPDRDALPLEIAALFDDALDPRADFLKAGLCLESLQAVVSVDTATAHQAGAQGRPCWVLLPWSADPRWLRDRDDTPWYPSLSLLRQGADRTWPPVITALLEQLSGRDGP